MNLLKKILYRSFSTSISGFYIILFALAIGVATFVENDFGTSSAQHIIFKTWWFELILTLFAISLVVNIFKFRMIQQKKWAILTFHGAIIVILAGAGVTRYFGSEGMMHIREGDTNNIFLSSESYLMFEAIQNGKKYQFDEPVQFSSLGQNDFKNSYIIGDSEVNVELLDFIPNPAKIMVQNENGLPILKIVMGGMSGREEYFLNYKESLSVRNMTFNFNEVERSQAINIKYEDSGLYIKSNQPLTQMVMATQQRDTLMPGEYHPLLIRSLYSSEQLSFVIADFRPKGRLAIASSSEKMASTSTAGIHLNIEINDQHKDFYVYGNKGAEGRSQVVSIVDTQFSISYGAKKVPLPFSIKLNKFIMERYPGTNSASSYAS